MKTHKNMFITAIAALILTAGCTDEFKFDIPEKEIPTAPTDPVELDVTLESLLDEMISYDQAAKFPAIAFTQHQESSYDRRSVVPGVPDWFANDDGWGFIRTEVNDGRTEKVIMDETVPGVITRMWLTSLSDNKAVVRFYFDGNSEPDWELPTFDLQELGKQISSAADIMPLGTGFVQPGLSWNRGSSFYLPLPYASGCKVTIEESDQSGNPSRYYQINFRRYDPSVKVESFSAKGLAARAEKVNRAAVQLTDPKARVSGRLLSASGTMAPDGLLSLELTPGSNAVNELRFDIKKSREADFGQTIESLILFATFDGKQTVAVPLSDFYLGGPGGKGVENYYITADGDGSATVRWIMPYQGSGRIELRNDSGHDVDATITARVGSFDWDANTLYFHAAWKSEKDVRIIHWSDYGNAYDWNFARIEGGRGVLRGDMFSIDNHTTDWYGEGDEKIWVDDETFPSHFGTGIEDYYSFCGYFNYNSPFSGEPRLDNGNFFGVNVHYRVRGLDAIPFNNKLVFDLEMEGHAAGTGDIRNTVIWYGDASTRASGVVDFNNKGR